MRQNYQCNSSPILPSHTLGFEIPVLSCQFAPRHRLSISHLCRHPSPKSGLQGSVRVVNRVLHVQHQVLLVLYGRTEIVSKPHVIDKRAIIKGVVVEYDGILFQQRPNLLLVMERHFLAVPLPHSGYGVHTRHLVQPAI